MFNGAPLKASSMIAREWDRLEGDPYNMLEYVVTMHYLEKHLPSEGLILDAGGGPGRYTIELRARPKCKHKPT